MAEKKTWPGKKFRSGSSRRMDKKSLFIQQITSKYKHMYENIQLVPFIPNKVYRVDKVFVVGGIEVLTFEVEKGQSQKWEKLKSYHDILHDLSKNTAKRFVEGNAGMGKSTLTLQLIYDWANRVPESYLCGVEVVILLRLSQLKGVTSISQAIKLFLLPRDSRLSERDISDILNSSSSVVVILDGFDEYPDQDRDSGVMSTLLQTIFQQFDVVITTRYLPKEFAFKSKRFRLTGFDDVSRNEYINKVIAEEDEEAAERIKIILRKNVILNELCKVPLFFVMFVHLAHESAEFHSIKTVTEFFRLVMKCVHKHFEGKVKDTSIPHSSNGEDHQPLTKIAFEGLIKEEKQTSWRKDEMISHIGRSVYHEYVKMGILLEEETSEIDETSGKSAPTTMKTTRVKFYHALFNEWYAAQYLSEFAARPDVRFDLRDGTYQKLLSFEEEDMLRYLDPTENEYVFRFASGLNSEAADKLDQYMTTRYGGEQFALLCVLEQSEKTEKVLKEINKMGTSPVMFHSDQSKLQHQSTIKLLQIAANEDYPISSVWIYDSFQSVDLAAKTIALASGVHFPVIQTLTCLEFREKDKTFSQSEVMDIVSFSSLCPNVKTVKFVYCLMPRFIQINSLSILLERNAQVLWDNDFSTLEMNLAIGEWQNDTGPLTDTDYQDEVELFERLSRQVQIETTEDDMERTGNGQIFQPLDVKAQSNKYYVRYKIFNKRRTMLTFQSKHLVQTSFQTNSEADWSV